MRNIGGSLGIGGDRIGRAQAFGGHAIIDGCTNGECMGDGVRCRLYAKRRSVDVPLLALVIAVIEVCLLYRDTLVCFALAYFLLHEGDGGRPLRNSECVVLLIQGERLGIKHLVVVAKYLQVSRFVALENAATYCEIGVLRRFAEIGEAYLSFLGGAG